MKIKYILALVLTLTGCAHSPWQSFEVFELSTSSVNPIAKEAVLKLQQTFAPAKTTFALYHSNPGAFGQAFELSLRDAGYGVTNKVKEQPEDHKPQKIVYFLDKITDTDLYRLSIRIDSGFGLDRIYQQDEQGQLVGRGAFAVRQFQVNSQGGLQ